MANRKPHSDSIDVEIFGSIYTLHGGSDPATVRALAADLDARMRELAAPASAADPIKVAVLAALRLGDEVRSARHDLERRESEIGARVETCAARIERFLSPGDDPDPDASGPKLDADFALG